MTIERFFFDAVTILAASVLVVLISHRLRLPALVGLLLTGVLIGPHGLRLIADVHRVELFAEIGVVFLLFGVGLEFSLERLREIGRAFFFGGTLQSVGTVVLFAGLALAAGSGGSRAIFMGLLITLSSTAIVLKLYGDRRETETPHGKLVIGILLFQDFLLVPMIVLTPVLAGEVVASFGTVAGRFAAALAIVAAVFVAARYLAPKALHGLARTGIRELFILGALLTCLGLALFTARLGFSLALGAFLAGIIVSESEYSHQLVADVTPFRDVFSSVFFISIGMLVDLGFVAANLALVGGGAAAVVAGKAAAVWVAVRLLGYPNRTAVLVALALAQVGEFSFVLLEVGNSYGLLATGLREAFVAAAVITMLATPLLVAVAPRLAAVRLAAGSPSPPADSAGRVQVLVVGYGAAGRALTSVLRSVGIRYSVVELSGDTARAAAREGEPVVYGDATRREVMEKAGVHQARAVVLVISDLDALRRCIALTRHAKPDAHIIVRTRLQSQIERLEVLGADQVVAEEYETSIEILTRVLQYFHVPRNVIVAETRLLRGETYRMLRTPSADHPLTHALLDVLAAGTTEVYHIDHGNWAAGRTLRELDFRRRTGSSVIAVVRGEVPFPGPTPDLVLAEGDFLVLVGSHAEIEAAFAYLGTAPEAAD